MDDRRRRHHRRRHLGGRLQGDRAHQQGPDAHSAQSRRRISPYQALQGRAARPARLHALRNGAPLRRIVRLGRHRGQGVRGDRRRPHRSRKVPRRGRGAGHPGAHQRRRRLHQLPHHPPEPLRRAGDAGPRILDGGQPGTGRKVCRKGDRQREIPPDADRGGVECRGDRHAQHAGDPLRTLLDAVPQELLRQTHLQRRHARALRRVQGGVRHGRSRHRQAVHPLVQHQHGTVHQALQQNVRQRRDERHLHRQLDPGPEPDPDSRNVLHRRRGQSHQGPRQGGGIPRLRGDVARADRLRRPRRFDHRGEHLQRTPQGVLCRRREFLRHEAPPVGRGASGHGRLLRHGRRHLYDSQSEKRGGQLPKLHDEAL